mgnify:CR=1 FL=1
MVEDFAAAPKYDCTYLMYRKLFLEIYVTCQLFSKASKIEVLMNGHYKE